MKTTPERTDLAQSINWTIERQEMMQFRGFFNFASRGTPRKDRLGLTGVKGALAETTRK